MLDDKLVLSRIDQHPTSFSYHNQNKTKKNKAPKACYPKYRLKADRVQSRPPSPTPIPIDLDPNLQQGPTESRKTTRSQTSTPVIAQARKCSKQETPCIICGLFVKGGWLNREVELFRISEIKTGKTRASRFLSAAKYMDDEVNRRCALLNDVGDVFAADIFYHPTCLRKYIMAYDRKVEQVFANLSREDEEISCDAVATKILDELDFVNYGYTLTSITNRLNDQDDFKYDNRRTKSMLLKHFGENLNFSYPRDKSVSQIVFCQDVNITDIIEGRLRKSNSVRECATVLRQEIDNFDFNMEGSLCLPRDTELATNNLNANFPTEWLRFLEMLMPRRNRSQSWKIKCDAAFQFFWHWVTGKVTPFHIGIAQMVHCLTKSKQIITTLNRLNLCCSYDFMKRVDVEIAMSIIDKAGRHRCPVNDDIVEGIPIQGAMDNFNHMERTDSGKEVSNDTVLVIFQNQRSSSVSETDAHKYGMTISARDTSIKSIDRRRNLETCLPCQQLQISGLVKKSGDIPEGFSPEDDAAVSHDTIMKSVQDDYFQWWYCRNVCHNHEHITDVGEENDYKVSLPSFIALNSKINEESVYLTCKSFIPILPYPATKMDSIFTTMLNFQDVLLQRKEPYGALWCDEGVYCIAKEIQLLRPHQFGNIFLGMGPFHWVKIIAAAAGTFLQQSGITDALVNSGVYGKGVAEASVMKGGDYIKAKEGMGIIAETMEHMQYESFLRSELYEVNKTIINPDELEREFRKLSSFAYSTDPSFCNEWETMKSTVQPLHELFQEYKQSRKENENMVYWNIFTSYIYPILRDFELAVRKGDWTLFLSGVKRSLGLFFATGRTNYSRFGPLFYFDSLDLQRKFPQLYRHFKEQRNFVCRLTKRSTSGIGFDQALEKVYNFSSKAVGGVIGVTRQKKSVALWDILKHQKDLYVSYMADTVNLHEDGELNTLHHEFSNSHASKGRRRVSLLIGYLKSINFNLDSNDKLFNVITKENLENTDHLLQMESIGKERFETYVQERLIDKEKSLHATISSKSTAKKSGSIVAKRSKAELISDDAENISATNYVRYAISRGKTVEYLLTFPLTSRPIYLLEKNRLFFSKAQKSDITKSLLRLSDIEEIVVDDNNGCPHVLSQATVIDLMSVIRRFTAVDLVTINTFGDLCKLLLNVTVDSYGKLSDEIHLIFENYQKDSPKSAERSRRAGNENLGGLFDASLLSAVQPLPDMKKFWSVMENKVNFQDFFVQFCCANYKGQKPLYLAGGVQSVPDKCTLIWDGKVQEAHSYKATHEEADDRMMFSINQIYQATSHTGTVTVVSPDADIFVSLLYHVKNTWQGLKLYLLKKGSIKGGKIQRKELHPLHQLKDKIDPNVIDNLPAGHSLTGCDTVAKVGTKNAMLQCLEGHSAMFLRDFGKDRLDGDCIANAEKFLAKLVCTKNEDCDTFDELRVSRYHHQSFQKRLIDLPCTSNAIRENIKRAFVQAKLWLESPFGNAMETMDLELYGYERELDSGNLTPKLFDGFSRPSDVPPPCKCTNCTKKTCRCRVNDMPCIEFCNCSKSECKNPFSN